ncbi:hypothetical protein [Chitinophaga sp. MM2321]|uniref:hypothetical protein n=1 Tax=Chitinophaga sp. MM2321 TaxID=3137178 RepID=UPI0032D57D16
MEKKEIAYHHLNNFVGKWNTIGRILPTSNNPEINIKGTDHYEWLPGGFFLQHKVAVLMGNEKTKPLK